MFQVNLFLYTDLYKIMKRNKCLKGGQIINQTIFIFFLSGIIIYESGVDILTFHNKGNILEMQMSYNWLILVKQPLNQQVVIQSQWKMSGYVLKLKFATGIAISLYIDLFLHFKFCKVYFFKLFFSTTIVCTIHY